MIDDKPTIAVLGPRSFETKGGAAAEKLDPRALGVSLAAAGYAVVADGVGDVSRSAVVGALGKGGDAFVVHAPDESFESTEIADAPGQLSLVEASSTLARTEAVLARADAIIVLQGDLSALASAFLVWSHGGTPDGDYCPIVLMGAGWRQIIASLGDAAGLDQRTKAMVTFVEDGTQAVESMRFYVSPKTRATG